MLQLRNMARRLFYTLQAAQANSTDEELEQEHLLPYLVAAYDLSHREHSR